MDDAISRDNVFKFLNRMEESVAGDDLISKTAMATIECARNYIAAIPSIDAVPVVRCGECRFFLSGDAVCKLDNQVWDKNAYCSYGERREDGDI